LSACFTAVLAAPAPRTTNITLFAGAGYDQSAYNPLRSAIDTALGDSNMELCIAHSHDGTATALLSATADPQRCARGLVLLGAAPGVTRLAPHRQPILIIAGTTDGVARFSNFAAVRRMSQTSPQSGRRVFAALRGVAHHSYASGEPSDVCTQLDIMPEVSPDEAVSAVAQLVADFAGGSHGLKALRAAEAVAEQLSTPVTDALELEGSTKLGHVACNSDFPTNPACQYPKYPDHSLPFGPAPAPSPPLPSDCVCGSPWVTQHATQLVADFAISAVPDTQLTSNDAYHDVSDTHPFHLPHIFNSCSKDASSCTLNTTSLTMPNDKAGDLFPNASDAPLSLYEFKSKIKSREALWAAAGLTDIPSSVDSNTSVCQSINQMAWDWALSHADAATRTHFETHGEPFVMVADKKATIGVTGPEWIADEMVYTRVTYADGSSHITVQSWYFPVSNTGGGSLPWFFPVGMHYCKLLSPARAMEWIYTDGLRAKRGLGKP